MLKPILFCTSLFLLTACGDEALNNLLFDSNVKASCQIYDENVDPYLCIQYLKTYSDDASSDCAQRTLALGVNYGNMFRETSPSCNGKNYLAKCKLEHYHLSYYERPDFDENEAQSNCDALHGELEK